MASASGESLLANHLSTKMPLILDGGLATELEQRGFDLRDPLWSARVLLEAPAAIEQLHYDYLAAGADVIITSSYQATFAGLAQRGLTPVQITEVFRRSVVLAQKARDRWWSENGSNHKRPYPLIAASVGPYGAALADGSEFHGDYGVDLATLIEFHTERIQLLAGLGADLLACESVPLQLEAKAIVAALNTVPYARAWISFTCRNETENSHGEDIASCAAALDLDPQIVAIGINCTAPALVTSLIERLATATAKPIVVYPNSGETWDPSHRCWTGAGDVFQFTQLAKQWHAAGAKLIGGCCRTRPQHICSLADAFSQTKVD